MLTYLIAHLSKKSKNGRDLKKTGESYRKVPDPDQDSNQDSNVRMREKFIHNS